MQAANRLEYDTIVLGVGGMGSAACFELARRGQRVLGLEQFSLVHDRGSSHGESRIIRKAYFEHPGYVPLLHRAYERWHALEQATGRELFSETGLVLSGPPDGETIQGARHSANLHGLELIDLTPAEANRRFPGIEFPADHAVAFEPGAGTLFVERCVRAHLDEALRHGAVIREREQVLDWSSDGQVVRVRTNIGEYWASQLVITAGAWASECLADVGIALRVLRKFVGWFPIQRKGTYAASTGTPTYFFELGQHTLYGFPSFDGTSLKVAEHSGGEPVVDPKSVDRECHAGDLTRLQTFLSTQLPGIGLNPVQHATCLYTMTSDQHFVVDQHLRWKNVAFAAGFSGHGFKFCSVIGEILADLVTEGRTPLPIEFLSIARPGLEFNQK